MAFTTLEGHPGGSVTGAWAGKLLPGKLQEQKPGPNLSVSIRHKNVLYKNCLYPANGILARHHGAKQRQMIEGKKHGWEDRHMDNP